MDKLMTLMAWAGGFCLILAGFAWVGEKILDKFMGGKER